MRCASRIDHPVGVHDEPDRGPLAVAEDLVHRDQVADQALHLGEDVLAGKRHVEDACARRAAPRRSAGAPRGRPCPATSGRRRGRRATAASRRSGRSRRRSRRSRPSAWCSRIWRRLKSSSIPGGTVSSSAATPSTPRAASRRPSHSCTAAQFCLHLVPAPRSAGPRAARRARRAAARGRPRASRRGCAPDRSRGRSCAARRRRNAARSRRRRSSCRRRPCPVIEDRPRVRPPARRQRRPHPMSGRLIVPCRAMTSPRHPSPASDPLARARAPRRLRRATTPSSAL